MIQERKLTTEDWNKLATILHNCATIDKNVDAQRLLDILCI